MQAYIVKKLGANFDINLYGLITGKKQIEWLGNEVSCGVGMQRIDIMLSVVKDEQKECIPVELKAVEASLDNTRQLQRYVDWIEQYYIPNRPSDVQPILIAKKFINKDSDQFQNIVNSFMEFNKRNQQCIKLKYIEFEVEENVINFSLFDYE